MSTTYKTATHDEAKAAKERGEDVEFRADWCKVKELFKWSLNFSTCEFRIAEPDPKPEPFKPCDTCEGTGRVTLLGVIQTCSKCVGRGAPIEVIHPSQPDLNPDPYAELKAAHAAGKVIQVWINEINDDQTKVYRDEPNPTWTLPPDRYRVKPEPDPLKIEAGKYLIACNALRIIIKLGEDCGCRPCTGQCKSQEALEIQLQEIRSLAFETLANIEPAPYDNWQHVPAWHKWMYLNSSGIWESTDSPTKPFLSFDQRWVHQGISLQIPTKFTPTNHTGDWTNSLQQRPE